MGKPQLTPWYPIGTKPARKGVYIASVRRAWFFRMWDGKRWLVGSSDLEKAAAQTRPWVKPGEIEWRGLSSAPKGAKP